MGFLIFILILVVFYMIGSSVEAAHYRDIVARESLLGDIPVTNFKRFDDESMIEESTLVMGSAVISIDYFKRFLAYLRTIFGGRIASYETLLDRARREATLRMVESANGYDMILNLKIEPSTIGSTPADGKGGIGCVEILAYGTAVRFRK